MNKTNKIKITIWLAVIFFILDTAYKISNNITFATREKCFIYNNLPRPLFLFFEHFLELFILILVGIFLAVFLEKHSDKYRKFYPHNVFQAFLYGSLLPICSCAVIPLVSSFKDKVKLRTIITFLIATPLLSPYLIALSLTTLGLNFTIIRIIASFFISITLGYSVEFLAHDQKISLPDNNLKGLSSGQADIYLKTFQLMKIIFPYFLIASCLGLFFEFIPAENWLTNINGLNKFLSVPLAALIGIPLYLCNGTDILMLRPFIIHAGLPWGTALAFSLTSTAVCASSIVLLIRYLGKKITYILIGGVFFLTLIMGILVNLF
jgi:hypothetical protein